MPLFRTILSLISLGLLATACTDVVELDVPAADTELVINGQVSDSLPVYVELSLTAPFFSSEDPAKVIGAQVELFEDGQSVALLAEVDSLPGRYEAPFLGRVGYHYHIEVRVSEPAPAKALGTWRSETEFLQSVPQIDSLKILSLDRSTTPPAFFPGEYVMAYFQEIGGRRDFIRVRRWLDDSLFARSFFIIDDRGIDGIYFGRPPFPPLGLYGPFDPDSDRGKEFTVEFNSISEDFNSYFNVLASQIQVGSPFDAPPALVLGNIRSADNPEVFAFGYFSASALSSKSLRYQP